MTELADIANSAERLDLEDKLAAFRSNFYIPAGTIYLDGNSLGLMSRSAEAAVLRVLDEWKRMGVGGWPDASPPWFFLAEELARPMAVLVGADADEVIVANSTTVNLHQLLATLLPACCDGPRSECTAILTDSSTFPSDAYAIDSFVKLLNSAGGSVQHTQVPAGEGGLLGEDSIIAAMTPEICMVILPAVVYTTGQLLDIERLTAEAHRRNILIGFDCSHSIGCVPHKLSRWGVDFAFWCTYKYLNGGPGAAGGLYINRRHFGMGPGLAGWFSSHKETQLAMAPTLTPAEGAGALQIGTPNILSMAPLAGSLATIKSAGIERIRAKSLAMTRYLARCADGLLPGHGFRVVTPRADHRRGGHIALAHPEAIQICAALKARGIVPDYRPPNIVRLAPVALYNTFTECRTAIEALAEIVSTCDHLGFSAERPLIP